MFRTGETIYEMILSVDSDYQPVSGATFTTYLFKDGQLYTGATVDVTLIQASTGVFASTWSASTTGNYRVYYKNEDTTVAQFSEIIRVKPDSEFEQTIYVGL